MPSIVPLAEVVSPTADNAMLVLLHALSVTTVLLLLDVIAVYLAILHPIVIAA